MYFNTEFVVDISWWAVPWGEHPPPDLRDRQLRGGAVQQGGDQAAAPSSQEEQEQGQPEDTLEDRASPNVDVKRKWLDKCIDPTSLDVERHVCSWVLNAVEKELNGSHLKWLDKGSLSTCSLSTWHLNRGRHAGRPSLAVWNWRNAWIS